MAEVDDEIGELSYVDGELDEVTVAYPRHVHLERLGEDEIWIGILLRDGTRICLTMTSKSHLYARAERD